MLLLGPSSCFFLPSLSTKSPGALFGGGGGLVSKLCPTLATPMDCSPPGSSVHGILQARILEWVAIAFSRSSSRLRNWTGASCIADDLPTELWGKPRALFSYRALSTWASQVALVVKNPPANSGHVRDWLDPYLGNIPWRRAWQLFLSRESHGQRSLVGYSPWAHKKSDNWSNLTQPSNTHFSGTYF